MRCMEPSRFDVGAAHIHTKVVPEPPFCWAQVLNNYAHIFDLLIRLRQVHSVLVCFGQGTNSASPA